VKCEKINFADKPDPAPRVIQPRSPVYNLELARFLKRAEKKIMGAIAKIWGGPTVLKGYNAEGQASKLRDMWDEFVDPVALFFDATRFDQHVSDDALRFEHSCYLGLFRGRDRDRLQTLLEWQLRNKGYARCEEVLVKYDVSGRRMSGDINTGMGNCVLMCAMMHGLSRELGIKSRLANNGDDCCLIVERRNVATVQQAVKPYFLKYGFVMEAEGETDIFDRIRFCQTSPVYDGLRWVMVREPTRGLTRDVASVLNLTHPKEFDAYCWAIGVGGMSLTGGIPLWQEVYKNFQSHGTPTNIAKHPMLQNAGMTYLAADMDRCYSKITPEARISFWRAFGVLPDVQEDLEAQYAGCELTPFAGERPPIPIAVTE
jgi:hypothetical protein